MKLIEIPENNNLILELKMNDQKFEFPSKCLYKDKTNVFCEPIRFNGKVLGFKAEDRITINLVMIRDGKSPYVWKGIAVNCVYDEGKTVYKLTATAEGYEMNRREAFRLFVGVSGVCQIGANRKALDVIVKDVSMTGFSFVSNENIDKVINMPVRLVFGDMKYNFSLMGLVVRKVVLEETKILYGCKISVENANLEKYINEKQRQLMSINKGNSAYESKMMMEKALKEPGIHETEDDVDYKKKSVKNDGTHKARDINTVGKTERRDIFKK